jgi:small conductance mechanosensitive channel
MHWKFRKTLKVWTPILFLLLNVIIISFLLISQPYGMSVTVLIASLCGLAVGLMLRDTLPEFFARVAVFAAKPFLVGDRFQLDIIDGFVETIGLFHTKVRVSDGHLIIVPNRIIRKVAVSMRKTPNIKIVMNCRVTMGTPQRN